MDGGSVRLVSVVIITSQHVQQEVDYYYSRSNKVTPTRTICNKYKLFIALGVEKNVSSLMICVAMQNPSLNLCFLFVWVCG